MSDTIIVQPIVNELTVTEDVNDVIVSSVGVQGPKGDTGATGATGAKGDTGDTGAQGPSGVVTVNAPLTNAGTSSAANLSISAGTTSAAGALQLTDSVSSTSTTTAATPNAVKTAYDLALLNPVLKLQSGKYRRTAALQDAAQAAVNNRIYYTPIFVDSTTSFDRLAFRTATTYLGTATCRMGIFSNSGGVPSTLILDAGTVSATAANTIYEITISQSLAAGFYWLAFAQQGTAPTAGNYLGSATVGTATQNYYMMSSNSVNAGPNNGYHQTGSTAFGNASSLTEAALMIFTHIRAA